MFFKATTLNSLLMSHRPC